MKTAERLWHRFVETVALLWILLFIIDVAVSVDLLAVSTSLTETNRTVLRSLLVVFVLDLVLLYRWSGLGPWEFLRSNWFLVLTVIPWFRPLRIGRSMRALRLLSGSRRIGSFLNKLRGMCGRVFGWLRE